MYDMQPLITESDGAPLFKKVALGQLGGLKAVSERLPDIPAVYAFVRYITPPPVHDKEEFVSSVQESIRMRAAPDHIANLGPLHKASLQSYSVLSERKLSDLEAYAENDDFRFVVRSVFEHAAALQAPLYVGKALSLQSRFLQHIQPMSDLNCRLREVGITLEQCILLYAELDSLPKNINQDALNLIEEILTRILRPGFVKRIG
jgi:MoxR-like ATPase